MEAIKRVTRIKYKNENGTYRSIQEFLGNNGTLLNIEINTVDKTVSVLQASGEVYSTVETAAYTNFNTAKKVGKEMLKKYGVQFYDETRKKKAKTKTEVA